MEKGYAGTTVRDISDSIGALAARAMESVKHVAGILAGEAPPIETFEGITRAIFQAYRTERGRNLFLLINQIKTQSSIPQGTRVYFLDKLRSATILGVVGFHSAVSYSRTAGFWPYKGEEIGRTLDLFLYGLDLLIDQYYQRYVRRASAPRSHSYTHCRSSWFLSC